MINKSARMTMLKLLGIALLTSLSSMLHSCNDLPTTVAYNLLADTVALHSVSTTTHNLITHSEWVTNGYANINTGGALIGRTPDAYAFNIAQFYFPDTLGYLKAEDIVSSTIIMYAKQYGYGDTASNVLSFRGYEVFRWDTAFTYETMFPHGAKFSPYIDYSKVLTEYEGKISFKDTMTIIEFPFSPEKAAEWCYKNAQKDTIYTWNSSTSLYDTTVRSKDIFGVALLPLANTNVIRQFSTVAGNNATRECTNLRVIFHNTKKDNALDTLLIGSNSIYFAQNLMMKDTKKLYVQGGVTLSSALEFDISMIPKYAYIHSAHLEMTLDPDESRNGTILLNDTIEAGYYLENAFRISNSPKFAYYGLRQLDASRRNIYAFTDIASTLQFCLRNDKKARLHFFNYGIMDRYSEINMHSFYGPDCPDTTKRPKLTIIYSDMPTYGK